MKKTTIQVIALILVLAVSADAQTITTLRAKHNKRACASEALPADCTQAQLTARGGTETVYATDAAFRDGLILPKLLAKEAEEDLSADVDRVVRAFVNGSKAERTAACSALKIVC